MTKTPTRTTTKETTPTPTTRSRRRDHRNDAQCADPRRGRIVETVRRIEWKASKQQAPLFTAKEKYLLYVGGLGSGKSWAGARKAVLKLLENPGVLGLIGANSYRQLRRVVIRGFREALREVGLRHVWRKTDSEIDVFVPVDGEIVVTTVIAATLDAKSESYEDLRGVEIGWAWLDEARKMPAEAFSVVEGRLRAQGMRGKRQIWLTTTPNGFDWIWSRFVDEARPDHRYFSGSTAGNRHLPPDYLATLGQNYDAVMAQQELEGKFIAREGKLYYAFDRRIHVSDKVVYNPKAGICLSWDFNSGERPMACAVIQDYGTETWVIDEIVIPNSNVPEVLEEFRRRYGSHSGYLRVTGDANGHTVGKAVGLAAYEMIQAGLSVWWKGRVVIDVPTANIHVEDSVDMVNYRLLGPKRLIALRLSPKCVELRKDFEQVKPKDGKRKPDGSDPMRTHISDAVRYFIARTHPVYKFEPDWAKMRKLNR